MFEAKLPESVGVFVVISGKGGVGKTVVSAGVALGLSLHHKVGLLDADITGPDIVEVLGLSGRRLLAEGEKILPLDFSENLKVVSMASALPNDATPVIWRSPLRSKALLQFVNDVKWGDIDLLVVDLPPGTGDEPLTVAQMFAGRVKGTVVVGVPHRMALVDVKKAINFSRKLNMPISGLVINMAWVSCPGGEKVYVFGKPEKLREFAEGEGIRVLAEVPLDPEFSEKIERGKPKEAFEKTGAGKALLKVAGKLLSP